MNVTCPECRSMFRVDPARLPETPIRARCSVCGGVIPIAPTTTLRDEFADAPRSGQPAGESPASDRSAPAAQPVPTFSNAPTPVIPLQAAPAESQVGRAPAPAPPQAAPPQAAPPQAAPPQAAPPQAAPPQAAPPRAAPAAAQPMRAPGPPPAGGAPARPAAPPARPIGAPPAGGARPASPFAPGGAPRPAGAPPAAPAGGGARPPFGAHAPQRPVGAPASAAASGAAAPAPPAAAPGGAAAHATPAGGRRPVNPFLANDPNAKARRLARALISDMVTYFPDKHRQAVESGTLKETFEEEIRKSYQEYVEQIGKEFAESTTHFQEALNEILARGQRLF